MFQPFVKGHMQAAYAPAPVAKSIQRTLKRHGFKPSPKVEDDISAVFVETVKGKDK